MAMQLYWEVMVIYKGRQDAAHFLEVDLDIYSKTNLQPLVSALGKRVFVLHVGRVKRTFCAHLELTRITKDADTTVRAWCVLIESLPKAERKLWKTATVRDFTMGVQAGTQPHSYWFALATETSKAAYEVGARIAFTVYAAKKH